MWFIFIIIAFFLLSYTGFCFEEFRYLSDEEKIRRAVVVAGGQNYRAHNSGTYIERTGAYHNGFIRRFIPYESAETFFKRNPNCCEIVYRKYRDDTPPSFFERLFGDYSYGVRIKYWTRYIEWNIDKQGVVDMGRYKQSYGEGWFPSGNCGGFFNR